jgi:hypothetical protein
MMRIPISALMLFSLGPVCFPGSAACDIGLSSQIKHIQLKDVSGLAALLHLGYEYGVCFGVENPGLGLLKGPREIDLSNATVGDIVRQVLGRETYQITESTGVVLIRNPDSLWRESQLDTRLPEFTIPRMSVAWANEAIRMRLAMLTNPSSGYAGHVSDRLPKEKTGPFAEDGKTVREVLASIVGGSSGAAWVSRRCPGRYRHEVAACWTIFQYQDQRQTFDSLLEFFSDLAVKEETGQKLGRPWQ